MNCSQVDNPIELKHQVNVFKHHILNLQKTYTKIDKLKRIKQSQLCPKIYPFSKANQSPLKAHLLNSKIFNRYEKQNLNEITNKNNILVARMLKIDSEHSVYHDPNYSRTMNKFKLNYLSTKYHDRKRILTQIGVQNKIISKRLARCSSLNRLSECNEWKKDCNKMKIYRENVSKKFPRISYDFRALAQKQIRRQIKNKNQIKLKI